MSIQNFLRYARADWAAPPQYVLLLGHSMTYDQFNLYSEQYHDPLTAQLEEMPTWGYPASDNMLAAANGASTQPLTPIGRMSAINGTELATYLEKVKEYESTAATASKYDRRPVMDEECRPAYRCQRALSWDDPV